MGPWLLHEADVRRLEKMDTGLRRYDGSKNAGYKPALPKQLAGEPVNGPGLILVARGLVPNVVA